MTNFVIKAFNKNYDEIPFAIEVDDFTMEIPEDCTLKKNIKKVKGEKADKLPLDVQQLRAEISVLYKELGSFMVGDPRFTWLHFRERLRQLSGA